MIRRDECLICNFCGKSAAEIEYMIRGPAVYICNECVDLCSEIISDNREKRILHEAGMMKFIVNLKDPNLSWNLNWVGGELRKAFPKLHNQREFKNGYEYLGLSYAVINRNDSQLTVEYTLQTKRFQGQTPTQED